jgi:hypothetical protein
VQQSCQGECCLPCGLAQSTGVPTRCERSGPFQRTTNKLLFLWSLGKAFLKLTSNALSVHAFREDIAWCSKSAVRSMCQHCSSLTVRSIDPRSTSSSFSGRLLRPFFKLSVIRCLSSSSAFACRAGAVVVSSSIWRFFRSCSSGRLCRCFSRESRRWCAEMGVASMLGVVSCFVSAIAT